MPFYAVYRKDNGELYSTGQVLANPMPAHLESKAVGDDAPDPAAWNPQTRTFGQRAPRADRVSSGDALRRFTQAERIAARAAAKADPVVEDLVILLQSPGQIDFEAADITASMDQLQTLGVITANRKREIRGR